MRIVVFYTFRQESEECTQPAQTLGYSPCEKDIKDSYSPLFQVLPGLFLPEMATLYCQGLGSEQECQECEKLTELGSER